MDIRDRIAELARELLEESKKRGCCKTDRYYELEEEYTILLDQWIREENALDV